MNSKLQITFASLVCILSASSAFAFGGYSSIVYNPQTKAYGSYHGASSRAEAEQYALAQCGQDCASVDVATLEGGQSAIKETWGYNGWVALSINGINRWGTGGQHDSESSSETSAYNNCGGQAQNCYILRSVASYVDYDDQDGVDPAAQSTTSQKVALQ